MIVKVKNETFWFSTYSMEMHSLTSSSFIICLWGETFGSRTILFPILLVYVPLNDVRAYIAWSLNPNYVNLFTRMISNFKYKRPPPGVRESRVVEIAKLWSLPTSAPL